MSENRDRNESPKTRNAVDTQAEGAEMNEKPSTKMRKASQPMKRLIAMNNRHEAARDVDEKSRGKKWYDNCVSNGY